MVRGLLVLLRGVRCRGVSGSVDYSARVSGTKHRADPVCLRNPAAYLVIRLVRRSLPRTCLAPGSDRLPWQRLVVLLAKSGTLQQSRLCGGLDKDERSTSRPPVAPAELKRLLRAHD